MDVLVRLDLRDSLDNDEYTTTFDGAILEAETGAAVGRIKAYSVDLDRAFAEAFPLPVLFFDRHLSPYTTLYSKQKIGELRGSLQRLLGCDELDFSRSVLVIDRIEVMPTYRGRDYGLQAMHIMLKTLSLGHRVAALKPFPLQCEPQMGWNGSLDLSAFTADQKRATRQLSSHYRRLGFRRLPGTELMVRDLADRYRVEWEDTPGVQLVE